MRPAKLTMQGFGPFRAETVIDFTGHDLVALTGPTGAGKSTIIDGITFALYGSVARYANEKLVAPIINAVSNEARVRLDFTIEDKTYTAVRVVRRAPAGASTKEARLESGDEVLASSAQQVTSVVADLIGLSFSQFTKTVVLPQGEFAQFLNVKPSVRQRLLRRMLGLDVYAEVGKVARRQAKEIKTQARAFEKTIDDRTRVTESELEELRATMVGLEDDLASVKVASDERVDAVSRLEDATSTVDELDEQLSALTSLAVPKEAKTFAAARTAAANAVSTSQKKHETAETKRQKLVDARAALPSDDQLSTLVARREEQESLRKEVAELEDVQKKAAAALDMATEQAAKASQSLAAAETALTEMRTLAGAQGIAAGLHPGDDCPVCQQVVESPPRLASADEHKAAVATAEAERDAAQVRAHDIVASVQTATAALADSAARCETLQVRVTAVQEELNDQPTVKQALALQKRAASADEKLDAATEATTVAAQALADATSALEDSVAGESLLRREFTIARDAVAALGPPTPSEDSLQDDWVALANWGKETAKDIRIQIREAKKEVTATNKAVAAADKVLLKLGRPHFPPNMILEPDRAVAMVQNAHADARLAFANAEDRYNRVQTLQGELKELDVRHAQAEELGKHLMSGMFERWIMSDVLDDLAARASDRLLELSSGAYSVASDGSDFQIRDHRNADELRNSRTLSGGETFLTSLSLALALADSIADLASVTTPALESMFLDEGFGTLDPETLDTVATAIEDLGSTGRLIGVVTHIADLADRLPNQVQVQPGPSGSTVSIQSR